MTLDARLSSIVDEASETFRTSIRDALAGFLVNLPLPVSALREVARRAYELGYREALASQGRTAADVLDGHTSAAAVTSSTVATTVAANGTANGDPDDYDDLDWVDEPDEPVPEPVARTTNSSSAEATVDWSSIDATSRTDTDADSDANTAERAERVQAPPLRIYPHATVGTLRRRIVDVFGLSRFDIDVIICRKGDRNRRQLKGTVKLSKYLVEE